MEIDADILERIGASHSVVILVIMEIVSILLFFDGGLHLVESLLDELTILYVENAVSVALDLWVMRHHYASCSAVLTLTLRTDAIDVENQIHDGDR